MKTAALIADLARLRRIETAARAAADASAVYDAAPCSMSLYREREAMKELRKVLTEDDQ